jgi:hypothetical protein
MSALKGIPSIQMCCLEALPFASVLSRLILYNAVGRSPWTAPDALVRHWPDLGVGPRASHISLA